MSATTEQQYFTRNELAARLRLRAQTLADWHCKGRGPRAVKVGGVLLRYPCDEVIEWERDPEAYEARRRDRRGARSIPAGDMKNNHPRSEQP